LIFIEIVALFRNIGPDGGAKQYEFPLSIKELDELGFVSEVKVKEYE